jgi:hypothetical protein
MLSCIESSLFFFVIGFFILPMQCFKTMDLVRIRDFLSYILSVIVREIGAEMHWLIM